MHAESPTKFSQIRDKVRAMSRRAACLLAASAALVTALAGCGKGSGYGSEAPGAQGGSPAGSGGSPGMVTKNTTRLGGENAIADAAAVARAVRPGFTEAGRPQVVVLANADLWPVALAASALAGAPLHAPLLFSQGEEVPGATADALATMRPLGAPRLRGTQVLDVGSSANPPGYMTRALHGSNPYATAAAVAHLLTALDGSPPRHVLVVNAEGPPAMAMPAAGLAAVSGAPILLVGAAGVPPQTRAALSQMHNPSIYAIGPPAALSERVLGELRPFGHVTRISGANPVDNAIAVASYSDGSFGFGIGEPGHGLVFASATRPLDAPAAATLSASGDYGPLLLLEGADGVPAKLGKYLSDIQPGYNTEVASDLPVHSAYNHGWLIGDERTISLATQAQLDGLLEPQRQSASSTPQPPPVTP